MTASQGRLLTYSALGVASLALAGLIRFIVDMESGKPTAQIGKALQVLAALGCSVKITPPASLAGSVTP